MKNLFGGWSDLVPLAEAHFDIDSDEFTDGIQSMLSEYPDRSSAQ